MSILLDLIPFNEFAILSFERRFARTPMGIYYQPQTGKGGFAVSEAEASGMMADCRHWLGKTDTLLDRINPAHIFTRVMWALFPIIVLMVTGFYTLASWLIAPAMLIALSWPFLIGMYKLYYAWKGYTAAVNARFAGRMAIDPRQFAQYIRRNPFSMMVPWLIGIEVATLIGLYSARFFISTSKAMELGNLIGYIEILMIILLFLLILLAIFYDKMTVGRSLSKRL